VEGFLLNENIQLRLGLHDFGWGMNIMGIVYILYSLGSVVMGNMVEWRCGIVHANSELCGHNAGPVVIWKYHV
jgi:hypothetical protein